MEVFNGIVEDAVSRLRLRLKRIFSKRPISLEEWLDTPEGLTSLIEFDQAAGEEYRRRHPTPPDES
jgi:hypothetical protein